jgi:hypothetical protein
MAHTKRVLLVLSTVFLCGTAAAQSQLTEHTFKLDDPEARPPATIEDVAWLAGSWEGEAFGASFEEVWNPPSAGSIVGMFKLMHDGEVSFYELILIVEERGSLDFRVKHFNPDFSAWEEKEDYINFRFVKADENAAHFSGFSIYRISDDLMHGYIVMRNEEGVREEKLIYRRR